MMNAILLTGSGAPPNPYYPVGADCVLYHAYWDGTAVDHSGSGNNGTLAGPSVVTNGLSFDGTNDVVNIVPATSLNIGANEDFTLFAWINPTIPSPVTIYVILAARGTSYGYWNLRYHEDTVSFNSTLGTMNLSVLDFNDYTGWQLWGFHSFRGASPENPKRSRFSVNGTINEGLPYGYTEIPSGAMAFGTEVIVGGWDYLGGYYFKGIMGELLLFKSFKDQTALTAYYNATKSRYGL